MGELNSRELESGEPTRGRCESGELNSREAESTARERLRVGELNSREGETKEVNSREVENGELISRKAESGELNSREVERSARRGGWADGWRAESSTPAEKGVVGGGSTLRGGGLADLRYLSSRFQILQKSFSPCADQ